MAVFRIERTRDYTVMSNHHLRNEKLSLKAKDVYKRQIYGFGALIVIYLLLPFQGHFWLIFLSVSYTHLVFDSVGPNDRDFADLAGKNKHRCRQNHPLSDGLLG